MHVPGIIRFPHLYIFLITFSNTVFKTSLTSAALSWINPLNKVLKNPESIQIFSMNLCIESYDIKPSFFSNFIDINNLVNCSWPTDLWC